jgi:hypothetical protein
MHVVTAPWLTVDFKQAADAGSFAQIVHRSVHQQRLNSEKFNADKGIGRE